jgi:trk system potassium uptake protein TrkH
LTAALRRRVPPLFGLTLGGTFAASGLAMLLCAAVGFAYGRDGIEFALPGALTVGLGLALLRGALDPDQRSIAVTPVSGLLAVTLAWAFAAATGIAPLLAAGAFDSPLDAYFESVSGFTTTGATLLNDVEAESQAVLLWRSVTSWLGGVGIVVLVVAIAPISGPGIQKAFYAETSSVTSDRLTPRIIDTAKIIAGIYLVLSTAAAIAYLAAGMGPFDAINHAMATIATGGFSTRTASIGAFDSAAIEIVAVAFMIIGGINFAFYWRAIRGKGLRPQLNEVLGFVTFLFAISLAVGISLWLAGDGRGVGQTALDSVFSVTTIITTTGFTTADFDGWNSFARTAILVTMFIGGCAGSTAGGIKVIRVMLLGKASFQELQRQIRPNAVRVLRIGSHVYREDVRRAVLGFFLIYMIVYGLGVLAMAAGGLEPLTAFGAASATLNLIGPGIGEVGALENYAVLSSFNRAVACVLMIAGRLEVFTVVALLAAAWERMRYVRPAS